MFTNTRKYQRVQVTLPIEVRPLNAPSVRAQTADICLGGCYVEMTFTQPIATPVEVTIWIGENKIRAAGEIVSSHPQVGNGMKFYSLVSRGCTNSVATGELDATKRPTSGAPTCGLNILATVRHTEQPVASHRTSYRAVDGNGREPLFLSLATNVG